MSTLINWFEIPVADLERAVRFYEAVFACTFDRQSCDANQMAIFPYTPPATGGALCHSALYRPGSSGCVPYLDGGQDLAIPLARVIPQGGKVLLGKTQISPEIGYMALFQDSEGNTIGLHSLA